jgi:hypothetical protein
MKDMYEANGLVADIKGLINEELGSPHVEVSYAQYSPRNPIWSEEGATILTILRRKESGIDVYSAGVRPENPNRERIGLHAVTLTIPLMSGPKLTKNLNMGFFDQAKPLGFKFILHNTDAPLEDLKWFKQLIEDSIIYGKRLSHYP